MENEVSTPINCTLLVDRDIMGDNALNKKRDELDEVQRSSQNGNSFNYKVLGDGKKNSPRRMYLVR